MYFKFLLIFSHLDDAVIKEIHENCQEYFK